MKLQELLENKTLHLPDKIVADWNNTLTDIEHSLGTRFARDRTANELKATISHEIDKAGIRNISSSLYPQDDQVISIITVIGIPGHETLQDLMLFFRQQGYKKDNPEYNEGSVKMRFTKSYGNNTQSKYDPRQEYINRQNSTQRARQSRMDQHQFSNSIGGDSSNYR